MPTIWNKVEDIQWQLQMQAVHLWHARNFIQHSTNDHGWNQSATQPCGSSNSPEAAWSISRLRWNCGGIATP